MFHRRILWAFGPDEGGGAAGGVATASPAGGAGSGGTSSPVSSGSGTGSGGATGGSPAAAVGAQAAGGGAVGSQGTQPAPSSVGGQAPAAGQSDWTSIRDAIKAYDPAFASQFQDDHGALQHLILTHRQSQQNNQLLQYGQQYMQHADKFQSWMREQEAAEQAKAAAQQAERKWFDLPPYDPAWINGLTTDPQTGEMRAKPNYPADLPLKVNQYAMALQQLQQKFWNDPKGTLGPMVQEIAKQQAQELIQQQLGGYKSQLEIQQFEQEHAPWLYASDANGQPIVNPATGQKQYSQWGQRFIDAANEAGRLGISTVEGRKQYAMTVVQRDYAIHQYRSGAGAGQQPGQQANTRVEANNAFLQQAATNQNQPTGSQPPANAFQRGQQDHPQPGGRMDLQAELRNAFKTAGLGPAAFAR